MFVVNPPLLLLNDPLLLLLFDPLLLLLFDLLLSLSNDPLSLLTHGCGLSAAIFINPWSGRLTWHSRALDWRGGSAFELGGVGWGMYLCPPWSVRRGRPHYPTFPLFSSWFLRPIYAAFTAFFVVVGLADV